MFLLINAFYVSLLWWRAQKKNNIPRQGHNTQSNFERKWPKLYVHPSTNSWICKKTSKPYFFNTHGSAKKFTLKAHIYWLLHCVCFCNSISENKHWNKILFWKVSYHKVAFRPVFTVIAPQPSALLLNADAKNVFFPFLGHLLLEFLVQMQLYALRIFSILSIFSSPT